jgi:hypothetical protein
VSANGGLSEREMMDVPSSIYRDFEGYVRDAELFHDHAGAGLL